MAARLNVSVCKAAEEVREEKLHKIIEEYVMVKLITQFNKHQVEEDVALKNELALEKAARKKETEGQEQAEQDLEFLQELANGALYNTF